MSRLLVALGLMAAAPGVAGAETAHDFSFTRLEGGDLPLAEFAGRAVLVVNTASFCGFTRQYEDLQAIWSTYRDRGLVVLGVPSNDFGRQEPGSAEEIRDFCTTSFAVDFPMTAKVAVKGDDAHPFYRWAGAQVRAIGRPKWNFHKYLIAPDGRLVDWFSSPTRPTSAKVRTAIEGVLPPAGGE